MAAQAEKPRVVPGDLGGLVAEFRGRLVVVPFLLLGTMVGFMIGHSGALPYVIAGLVVGGAVSVGLFLLGFSRWRQLTVKVYSGGLVYRAKGTDEAWKWGEVEEFFILAEKREFHSVPHGIVDAIFSLVLDAGVAATLPKAARYQVQYRIRRLGHQLTFDSMIRGYARLGEIVQEFVTGVQLPAALASFRSGDTIPFGELLLGPDGLAYASAKHPRSLPLSALAGVSVSRYAVKVYRVGRKLPWLTAERSVVPNATVLAELAARIVADRDHHDGDEADGESKSGQLPGTQ
jgi:Family of unknown function (DUF6585)